MPEINRRTMLLAPMLNFQLGPRVTVVGAGAFGGWSALHLQRQGARVTLVDAWGPGNSRASSGGETRITRAAYADKVYADLTVRALELWRQEEKRGNQKVFFPCGVIRLQGKDSGEAEKFLAVLRAAGVKHEQLPAKDAARRFPQFDFQGVDWVLYEPEHGMLRARRGCELVLQAFLEAGGQYRQEKADPAGRFDADAVVWACGPWLGRLFPDVVKVRSTRQEVFFFGVPAGETMYQETRMPCWIDDALPGAHYYGTPGNDWRGFKIGDDAYGPEFDPDNGERQISPGQLAAIRRYMKTRFPKLAGAPLVESRVCQYEVTPDAHLILDRHPANAKFWLVGGGSGHGYKLGAAVGERVAQAVLGKRDAPEMFRVARFRG